MAVTTALTVQPADGRGLTFAPPFSAHVDEVILSSGAATTVTVPANATHVLFSATADFRVRLGGTATIPDTDIVDGSAAALNPAQRAVVPGQTLSLIAEEFCRVTLEWYR